MITRTITLAGNPNITHTLYFDSKSNAEKFFPLPTPQTFHQEVGDSVPFGLNDDYGQRIVIHEEAVIISDILQNGAEMLRAQAEIKLLEIKAQGKMQKRINEDAELKVMRAEMARSAPPANA